MSAAASIPIQRGRAAPEVKAEILPFAVMCVGMFIALLDIQIVASSLQDIGGGLSALVPSMKKAVPVPVSSTRVH